MSREYKPYLVAAGIDRIGLPLTVAERRRVCPYCDPTIAKKRRGKQP
jgi:hypothetical protein